MITVGMNYEVIEGKEEAFVKMFNKVIDALNAAEGHTESHLWEDVNKRNSFLITSDWNDEEAFNAFIASEDFAKVTNWGSEQILAGRPRHKVYKA